MDDLRKQAWVLYAAMASLEPVTAPARKALATETALRSAAVMSASHSAEQAVASILLSSARFCPANFDLEALTGFGDSVVSRVALVHACPVPQSGTSLSGYEALVRDAQVSHIILWDLWYDVLALWNSAQGDLWSGWWYLPESPFYLMDRSDLCVQVWEMFRGDNDPLVGRMRQMLQFSRNVILPH